MMAFDDYHTWSPASISTTTTTTTTTKKKLNRKENMCRASRDLNSGVDVARNDTWMQKQYVGLQLGK